MYGTLLRTAAYTATVLGDSGTAIADARTINPVRIPTSERVASAGGRYGPPVRRMTQDPLHKDRLPGLRDFSERAGVSAWRNAVSPAR